MSIFTCIKYAVQYKHAQHTYRRALKKGRRQYKKQQKKGRK